MTTTETQACDLQARPAPVEVSQTIANQAFMRVDFNSNTMTSVNIYNTADSDTTTYVEVYRRRKINDYTGMAEWGKATLARGIHIGTYRLDLAKENKHGELDEDQLRTWLPLLNAALAIKDELDTRWRNIDGPADFSEQFKPKSDK